MNILEKKITKRQLFVTVGCQQFPYQKIKELTSDFENLNYKDILKVEIEDYAKVIVIQEFDFFNDSLKRVLAFKFAEKTYSELNHLLDPGIREEADIALEVIRQFIFGEKNITDVRTANEIIIKHRNKIASENDINASIMAIGCLEILLSVTKKNVYNALKEASSIQRDIMGEESAKWQLKLMSTLAENLNDLNY